MSEVAIAGQYPDAKATYDSSTSQLRKSNAMMEPTREETKVWLKELLVGKNLEG